MVSANAVDVAQHWAIQDTSNPLSLLLQPWQNQSLNHLLERREARSSVPLGFLRWMALPSNLKTASPRPAVPPPGA